jgi:hypothetical protein
MRRTMRKQYVCSLRADRPPYPSPLGLRHWRKVTAVLIPTMVIDYLQEQRTRRPTQKRQFKPYPLGQLLEWNYPRTKVSR